MSGTPQRRGGMGALLAGVLSVPLLAGCFGDPEPDPATAPLEVVLDSCTLNRPDVAPGTHEVTVIGTGSATFTGEDGTQELVVDGGQNGMLTTTAQRYTVTCTVGETESTVTLISAPG